MIIMAEHEYPTESNFTTEGTDIVNTRIRISVSDGQTHIAFGVIDNDGKTRGTALTLDTDDPFATISLRDLHRVLERLNEAAAGA